MLRLNEISFKKISPLINALGKAGFDEKLASIIRKEGNAARAVEVLCREFFPDLSDEIEAKHEAAKNPLAFSAAEQVKNLLQWNESYALNFTEEQILAMENSVPHLDLQPLHALVLVPYLGTVEESFEFWMKVLKSIYSDFWRWHGLKGDEKHLRLLKECGEFPVSTLRWELIDLSANWHGDPEKDGVDPKSVRGENSAHFGIYAICAHYTDLPSEMDGTNVPHLWIPGLEVTVDGDDAWMSSPYCYWYSAYRALEMRPDLSDRRRWYHSSPVIRGIWV